MIPAARRFAFSYLVEVLHLLDCVAK